MNYFSHCYFDHSHIHHNLFISYVIESPTSFAASTMALAADGEDDEDDEAGAEESHPRYCQYSNTLKKDEKDN